MQWAVITSGPSPVSVLVYYPWYRSDWIVTSERNTPTVVIKLVICILSSRLGPGPFAGPSEPFIAGAGAGRVKGGL